MHILVIGGTQFIGRDIVHRLLARGHEVSVLHRTAQHDLGPAVRNVQADRGDLDAVRRAMAAGRYEAVFDLAYDWQKGTPASHVEAAARACGDRLHRYVFMSSIAAYGAGLDHGESDPLVPDDAPRIYSVHKASAERALFRMRQEAGFPVSTFRPPHVHGPGQPSYREQFFWDRLLDGRPIVVPDDGSTPMQWVFVSDIAEACVRAMEVPEAAGEAFNMAHPPTTQRGFVEALARAAGIDPNIAGIPRDRIRAAGGQISGEPLYFGEVLDLPPATEVVEKAPRVLGVTPTPLDAALRRSFEWYRSQPRRPVDYAFEDRLLARA